MKENYWRLFWMTGAPEIYLLCGQAGEED